MKSTETIGTPHFYECFIDMDNLRKVDYVLTSDAWVEYLNDPAEDDLVDYSKLRPIDE